MSWGVMKGQLSCGFSNEGWRKGPWTSEEDRLLIDYVRLHGEGRWNSVANLAGLRRNGKSCRLRWVNYLRPDLKKGQITLEEECLILELHSRWGNRWSTIARSLPGRTDNEIKNYWRTHFKKKTKYSSAGNSNKAKLRSQQVHFQQEQQQLNQPDMESIRSLLDEGDNSTVSSLSQGRQETVSTYQYITEDKGIILDSVSNDYNVPLSEALSEEMIFWDGFMEHG